MKKDQRRKPLSARDSSAGFVLGIALACGLVCGDELPERMPTPAFGSLEGLVSDEARQTYAAGLRDIATAIVQGLVDIAAEDDGPAGFEARRGMDQIRAMVENR